jgi:hypothetical protein
MADEMHHLSISPSILRRGFWLYVWRIGLPTGGDAHYVGMTGDTGTAGAQTVANRIATHLGYNIHSNALRRYILNTEHAHLEDCRSLEFFAFGPVYPRPVQAVDYPTVRGKVAALEKHLWKRMQISGYDMLNPQPRATDKPDEDRLDEICASFRRYFAKLR